MPNPLIDLATQVRTGAAFALKPQGGGTGRIDARATGTVVTCKSRDESYTLVPGDVVEIENTYAFGAEPGVKRTSVAGGRVFGVILEGGPYNAQVAVLSGGACRLVKLDGDVTNGQFIYGSASGGALGSTPLTAGIFGVALADGSSGDLIPAYLECDIVFVGRHGQLGDSTGIRAHTDLVRGAYIMEYPGWSQGSVESIRDGDTSTYLSELTGGTLHVDFDLGRPTPIAGMRMVSNYSGGPSNTPVSVLGDDDPAFGSPTTIFTTAVWASSGTDHEELFTTSGPFRYYRVEIDVGAGQFYIQELTLWEAVGAVVHATDPATGDAALLDDILASIASTVVPADPSLDTAVWMPLTTIVSGDPELVWDADGSLIPTLIPI